MKRLITKSDRLAARHKPSSCTETIETSYGVIYHSADKSVGIAYRGTASRSEWYYTFRSPEAFDKQAQNWIQRLESWAKYRADQKAARKPSRTTKEIWEKARQKGGESGYYLSVAETAILVRKSLAREFPAAKFSVRSDSYSGGASIRIYYSGDIDHKAVEALAHCYEGSDFDGSIDLKTSRYSWLYRDGSASLAINNGTQGSGGVIPETIGSPLRGDAVLVHFGANYIFVNKEETK